MKLRHRFTDVQNVTPSLAFKFAPEALLEVLAKNYSNYDPYEECSEEEIKNRWLAGDEDKSWKHCTYQSPHSGKTVHQYRSNAAHSWNGIELRFSLGLYSVPHSYERAIKTFNDLGFNVVLNLLTMMGRHDVGIPDSYPLDVHDFFANRDLEIDRGHDHEDKLIIGLTHSTSGAGNLSNGTNLQKQKAYKNRGIIGFVDAVPFCAMAGANTEFHPFWSKRFNKYASKTKRELLKPGETWGGYLHHQLKLKVSGEPEIYSSIDEPTYPQILEMDNMASKAMTNLQNYQITGEEIPRVIIAPQKNDSIACPKMALKAQKLIGAEIHQTDHWHNPFQQCPHRAIARTMLAVQKFVTLETIRRQVSYAATSEASPWSAPHAA